MGLVFVLVLYSAAFVFAAPEREGEIPPEWSEVQIPEKDASPTSFLNDVASMKDSSISPCHDFYRHACGGWQKHFQLPQRKSEWVFSFSSVAHRVNKQLAAILTPAGASVLKKPLAAKMLRYHHACTDTKTLNSLGLSPLRALVQQYTAPVKHAESLVRQLALLKREHGLSPMMALDVGRDSKHPSEHIASLDQGGITMPARSYYLDKSPENQAKLLKLEALMTSTLELYEMKDQAKPLLQFESELAKLLLSNTALRDPEATYHLFSEQQLAEQSPLMLLFLKHALPPGYRFWSRSKRGLLVSAPQFFKGLDPLLKATDPELLKAYLAWRLHRLYVFSLSDAVSQPFFDFFVTEMSGQKLRESRAKRCVAATAAALPELVGQAFAAAAPDNKRAATELIQEIETAFKHSLERTEWLSTSTRTKALGKLALVGNMVAHPGSWREYSGVQAQGNYFENELEVELAASVHNMNKLGAAVDASQWGMGVYEANAYYDATVNRMVFPIAILQPPMFDAKQPTAANYGAIGVVMGHELSHGFDDQGSLYDGEGVMTDWWTKQDRARFKRKAQCIAREYASFKLPHLSGMPSHYVKGNLTLGEDLADNGGLHTANKAMHAALHKSGQTGAVGALSADQVFFYSFAHVWCTKASIKSEELQAATDPHAPSEDRVNGAVRNSVQFAAAFKCQLGSKMAPKKRCIMWGADAGN